MATCRIRCEIPPEVREYVRVTSWLHEEGTAIEIFPEKVKIDFITTYFHYNFDKTIRKKI